MFLNSPAILFLPKYFAMLMKGNQMTSSCYITFPTTFFAIRAESILKKSDYRFKMVPVPRSISSSCGTALQCQCESIETIKTLFLDSGLELEGFYRLEEKGIKKPVVEKLDL